MACTYCREEDDKTLTTRKEILSYEEICRIIKAFHSLGINKIRLTGGEPLLRKDIVYLIENIKKLSNTIKIPLSTNALLLRKMAQDIKDAGVDRVNISLDSINPKKFDEMTRGGDLVEVLRGIDEAKKVGLYVKINMVVDDRNMSEIEEMVQYAIDNELDLRFIETMPIGKSGIGAMVRHITEKQIMERVAKYVNEKLDPVEPKSDSGPSKDFNIKGTKTNVGSISAVSNSFCGTCNRVRLTAKGVLILCLGQDNSVDLRKKIRDGATDDELRNIIIEAITKKPKEHFFNINLENIIKTQMVELGG
jgi:cyclic pyranopterin phosphate synthase